MFVCLLVCIVTPWTVLHVQDSILPDDWQTVGPAILRQEWRTIARRLHGAGRAAAFVFVWWLDLRFFCWWGWFTPVVDVDSERLLLPVAVPLLKRLYTIVSLLQNNRSAETMKSFAAALLALVVALMGSSTGGSDSSVALQLFQFSFAKMEAHQKNSISISSCLLLQNVAFLLIKLALSWVHDAYEKTQGTIRLSKRERPHQKDHPSLLQRSVARTLRCTDSYPN